MESPESSDVIEVELAPSGAERDGNQPGGPLRAAATFAIRTYETELAAGKIVKFTPEANSRSDQDFEETAYICAKQGYELTFYDGQAIMWRVR
jgi:hypothetical protein